MMADFAMADFVMAWWCLHRTDETEHCFGESCIFLAAILPYSKQIVHQESQGGPLQLLERFERQLTVPIEPKVL